MIAWIHGHSGTSLDCSVSRTVDRNLRTCDRTRLNCALFGHGRRKKIGGTTMRELSTRDIAGGLLVPVIWGLNFVVIRVGLDSIPPLLLAAMRFGLVGAIGIWVVPKPDVPWSALIRVGMAIGVGQFGVLFVAIDRGMPAGLAGVVIQIQVVFTIVLAWILLRERPGRLQLVGILIALVGLVALALDVQQRLVVLGFVLTIAAGLSWSLGNLQLRKLGQASGLGIVVWSSLIPPVPLVALSLLLDGPDGVIEAAGDFTAVGLATVLYQSLLATLVAFGIWVTLLGKHPAASVTPFALLVPAVSLMSNAVILNEPLSALAMLGTVFVTAGLAIPYLPINRDRIKHKRLKTKLT